MNRRFFFKALASTLGFFGLSKFVKAEEPNKVFNFFRNCDEATMNQILEQVISKFSPTLIHKAGKCHLVSMANNLPLGDKEFKVLKYNLNLVVAMKGKP